MKRIGAGMIVAGAVLSFLLAGTDDYYTMVLHQSHAADWTGCIAAIALMVIGMLVRWIGSNFYIQIRIKRREA